MKKRCTTVYLTAAQDAELGRLSGLHGRSMADLIREGVNMVLADLGGTVEHEDAESRRTIAAAPLSARVRALELRLDALDARSVTGQGAPVEPPA